jgi:hypothetical protein
MDLWPVLEQDTLGAICMSLSISNKISKRTRSLVFLGGRVVFESWG